jgi:hypothetical protein
MAGILRVQDSGGHSRGSLALRPSDRRPRAADQTVRHVRLGRVMAGIRAARTSLGWHSRRDRVPLLRDDPRADDRLLKTSETIAADENKASRSGRDRPLPRLPRFVHSGHRIRDGGGYSSRRRSGRLRPAFREERGVARRASESRVAIEAGLRRCASGRDPA